LGVDPALKASVLSRDSPDCPSMKTSNFLVVFSAVSVALLTAVAGAAPAMKPGQITADEATRLAVYSPRPDYPLVARQRSITGSGVVLVKVNDRGLVTSATMAQSTDSPILDAAATAGFKRWRFKSGRSFWFRSPITFTTKLSFH
jgi:TonB family protein